MTKFDLWQQCLVILRERLLQQEFETWLKPLQVEHTNNDLALYAPNDFVKKEIEQRYLAIIKEIVYELYPHLALVISLSVGGHENRPLVTISDVDHNHAPFQSNLNPNLTFSNFVGGKSNQLARAAGLQISTHFGNAHGNPLLIYGAVGLGKTHLMHAVGNAMLQQHAHLKVLYLHSERFVSEMIRALQINRIRDFKEAYRSIDALFIDDIQFFAGKDRSQEELFHIFNSMLESGKQMGFICDRYPKEIGGLEERLKSRFGWGLTVAIEPPDLETRVAILLNKSQQMNILLTSEVAFFIGKHIRSNVRELEGALKRVAASAQFTGQVISVEFVRNTLKDLIALQDRLVTIENIQKTVADYYKLKVADLLSQRRTRSITRPRQVAMALTKELTNRSLPEIGAAFGGRDHTTVIHACKAIQELRKTDTDIERDMQELLRLLST